jgi:small subunit ribosomal protein S6
MRHYETTYILRPNLGEDQFTEIIERTNAIITDDGGTVIEVDRWGIKKLAYEIKKETQGYYVYMSYAALGKTVNEIERIFRIDDRLLRYLTIKLADAIDAEGVARAREQIAEAEAAAKADEEQQTEESAEKTDSSETVVAETKTPEQTTTTVEE